MKVLKSIGLETLRKHSAKLAISVEHSEYGNYFLEGGKLNQCVNRAGGNLLGLFC